MTSDWCATYSPTCGICRERRKCAREALRKARATAGCQDYVRPAQPGCFFEDPLPFDRLLMWDNGLRHSHAASALLDGFTVEELTEAGG